MPASHVIENVSEPQLLRLGEQLAFIARRGDLFALSGELGAGKTTLARAIIHALIGSRGEEIPSPTFTLVQTYATPRMPVAHFDLYRVGVAAELEGLPQRPPLSAWERETLELYLRRVDLTAARREELALMIAPALGQRMGVTVKDPVRFLALLHHRIAAFTRPRA